MYTKIVWHKVLTECQRLLFKAIHEEMNDLHMIIHPKYKYVPKPHEPERQQSPVANGEQLSAVPSSSSVSSQSTQAKHANADANADSRPAKRQCLATEKTAAAAQQVITIPEDVPNAAEGSGLDGPHHMGYHSAGNVSTVAPFNNPPPAPVDQSDPYGFSLQLQQQYPEDLQLAVHQAALKPPSFTNHLNESTGFSYNLPSATLSQWSDPYNCLLPPPADPTSSEMDPSLVVDSFDVNNQYAEAARSSNTAAALALPEAPIPEDDSGSLDYLFYEMPEDNSNSLDSLPVEIPEDDSESLDDLVLDDIIVID
ncbi:hypothetical protein BZA70DRAFT_283636 [Myxozyma melibiosi]|uniref:Uncharacterized protein n=1 Tax=Myxozyma melibiosi TaxID=54550 RepID=A0ABR1F0N0_9ASCO